MNTFLKILQAVLGEAEQIVPVFIHNPKSQQIESVVVSTLPGIISALATVTTATVPTTTTTTAPTAAPADAPAQSTTPILD